MPEISRFFGVVITMYYNDHNPPHFHARYGDQKAVIGIEPLRLLEGSLPPRAIGFVMEWAALHRNELLDDWQLARSESPLRRIAPLE
jgi:Domain of unknown function (DUF4160)